ncbi:hypothetical protein [Alicyclobacillus sp. ALC3]|uniref:hypothetical protein n=1 Tax=Alicyclobacillus sp. ALC3 TaxID=2796143 RepID=UPI0023781BF6|nr:hypothetical protein [Alicyclobacillus sp. ALC3]WDL96695.1 hypothetical protein JC200_20710 [Alicyclobacillus sp. ALC3]
MNNPLKTSLRNMLREAFEGPANPKQTWFTNNEPNSGFFGVLDELSANEASTFVYGTTLAAHANHVRYHISGTNELLKSGQYPEMNWVKSWATTSVTEQRWNKIREELRSEYSTLMEAFDGIQWNEQLSNEVLASLAHSTYHLGAIQQMLKVVKHD